MKKLNLVSKLQMFAFTVMMSVYSFAQEASDLKVDVDIDKPGDDLASGDWMSNPLVWVIGALVLILIIALVARGGGNKN